MSSSSRAQLAGDLDAVHARQAEVEHDQVGEEGLGLVQRLGAVVGDLDVVALHAQRALQHLGDLLVVLDDEHANGAVGSLHPTDTRPVPAAQRQVLPRHEEAGAGRRASKGVRPNAARPPSPHAQDPEQDRQAEEQAPRSSLRAPSCRSSSSATSTSSGSASWPPRSSSPSSSTSDWDGGQAGDGAVEGLQVLLGAGHYVVPAALMAAGAILVLRPVLPAVRPFKAGAICLFAALSLGLAAGTLGIGPGGGPVAWEPEWVKPRGGVVGEGLYWAVSSVLGDLGAHTIALFLFAAAVLLLTGASVAGVLKATSDSIATTTREVRTAVQRRRPATEELTALELGPPPRASAIARTFPEHDETLPDVLGDAEDIEPTVEWTVPELELPEPDEEPHLAEDPETDEPGVARTTPDRRAAHAAGALPRRGHRVARLRMDDPRHRLPQALERRGEPARHRRPGEGRRPAGRGARALRRRGAGHRHGRRPAHHALRAAPRARHQGRQGRPAQGRPRLRAGRLRHPHPRPDPRQAGRRRRGPQRAPPDRPPRRRAAGAARGLVAADGLAGQGRRGPGDRRRPGEDAAPARGGHDRRRQVRLRQRDARLRARRATPARAAARARRPQAGRAQPLRVDPAPAHARHHEPAQGRQRAAEPRARDGGALRVHVARPHALAGRAQQGQARSAASSRCPTSCA